MQLRLLFDRIALDIPGAPCSCQAPNLCTCSFAVVIQQLPAELRTPICVFYLVLRALDTVEDDMAVPIATKVPVLKAFHEKISDRYLT